MSDTPTIEVLEFHREEVEATGADLSVVLSDAKFFSGAAALQQAGEVRKLVEALVGSGITDSDIGIASVRVNASKGVLLKASSATYVLAVRCRDPNKVAAVIDAAATVKNCSVGNVSWRYDVPDSVREGWLASCVKRARGAAEAMAQALGSRIARVHRVADETYGASMGHRAHVEPYGYEKAGLAAPSASRRMRVEDALEGMELAPKKEWLVKVRVWFAIAA